MLVGSNHGAVDTVDLPIAPIHRLSLLLQLPQDPPEDAGLLPAVEATGHGTPRTIAFRQIAPGRSRAEDPQDAIQDSAMLMSGATPRGFLRWEQRLQPLPRGIGHISSVHRARSYPERNRICKHALVDGQPIGMLVYGSTVTITDPSHLIFQGVSNADLSNWYSSYHGFFATGSLTSVAIETNPDAGPSGQSVIRVGSYGAGTIVGWTLDPDNHRQGAAFVRNALNFAAGHPSASAQEGLQPQRAPHARQLVP
jgi:hypothetical protein